MPKQVTSHAGIRRLRRIMLSGRLRQMLAVGGAALVILASWWAAGARGDYSAAEARLAALSPVEKDRLRRNYDRFAQLDRAEQKAALTLESELTADPRQAELRAVMRDYYQWLTTLTAGQRAELARLATDQRVARIRELRAAQARDAEKLADRLAIVRWIDQKTLERLMTAEERKKAEQAPPMDRRLMVLREMRRGGLPELLDHLEPTDFTELRAQLSPRLDRELDAKPDRRQRWELIAKETGSWMRSWGEGGSLGLFSPEEQAENQAALKEFFENKLDDAERDRLLSLPPDEMERELRKAYLFKNHGEQFRQRLEPLKTRQRPSRRGPDADQPGPPDRRRPHGPDADHPGPPGKRHPRDERGPAGRSQRGAV